MAKVITKAKANANLRGECKQADEMGDMMALMMESTAKDITPSQPLVAAINPGHSKWAIAEATAEPMKRRFIRANTSDSTNESKDADVGYGALTGNDQSDLDTNQF